MGYNSLSANTTAEKNTAVGASALVLNTTGAQNVAVGALTLDVNTTGGQNTACGEGSLSENTTASNNTALGFQALEVNTTGANNTACGANAGDTITDGYENTIIGSGADADNASRVRGIALGVNVTTHPTNFTFRVEGSNGVYHTGNTTTWSTTSDERIKKDIVDSSVGLAEINKVKIRNFKYRTASEITATELQSYNLDQLAVQNTNLQIGVIAQEFETVFHNSVKTDDRGIKNVCEDEMIFALVKAVQELSVKVTALEAG